MSNETLWLLIGFILGSGLQSLPTNARLLKLETLLGAIASHLGESKEETPKEGGPK